MRIVLLSITVSSRRDVSDALRHAAARTRSEYPTVNNPVAWIGVLVHLGTSLGSLTHIKQRHNQRERDVELSLVKHQYIIVEAFCEDCVEDEKLLAALNRSLQKNLVMDSGEFQCRLLTHYDRKDAQ